MGIFESNKLGLFFLIKCINLEFSIPPHAKTKYLDYYDEYAYKKLDETSRKEYTEHLINLGFETVYSPTAGTTWRKKIK